MKNEEPNKKTILNIKEGQKLTRAQILIAIAHKNVMERRKKNSN